MTTKRRFIKHLPLMLAGLAMSLGVFINFNSSKHIESATAETNLVTYYSNVNGSGSALLSSIANVIGYDSTSSNNKITDIGYDNLKAAYTKTDVRSDGKIRDIYSDNTSYTPGSNFAGSYSDVGDGYNREHVIPKSWWGHTGSSNPTKQGSDLFIVLPSDAKANGMRSNYPYGLTNSTTMYKMSNDPVGNKLGTSSNTSYVSGTVFEPFEDRKGDIARIYFYAAAAYKKGGANNGAVTTWTEGDGSKVFASNGNNGFVQNYLNLLLKWHKDDPVSQFEIDRNENVQTKTNQGNRNPFVDHPSWVDLIWGGTYTGTNAEDTTTYKTVVNGQLGSSSDPYASISPSSTSVAVDANANLTATLSNVTDASSIAWTSSDISKATVTKGNTSTTSSVATVTGVATGSATINCKYNGTTIGSATVNVTSSGGSGNSNEDIINNAATSSNLGDTSSSSWGTDFTINGASGATYYIHSMGTKSTSNALQWNTNGYLYSTVSGGTIVGVSAVMTSGKSVDVYGSNSAYSGNSGGTQIGTITGTDSLTTNAGYTYILIKGASSGNAITSITIQYGSSQSGLSSIEISTVPTKTTYTVGEYFNPSGLVIRRNYSSGSHDTYTYSGHTSEFTFDPSTSTALTVSHTSVTIRYGGKTCTQAITVNKPAVTSITASVSKTFYVGETITKSDISVTDSNGDNVDDFTFSNNNYQFTYSDAASGGASTSKTFTNAISGSNKTCSLTVQVQRKAFVTPSASVSDTLTRTTTGVTSGSTTYTSWSNKKLNSNAIYAGQSAGNYDSIQLRSDNNNSGIVQTTSGGKVSSIAVSWNSNTGNGRTINIYGKNVAFSSPADLYSSSTQGTLLGSISKGTTSFTVSGDYTFIGIRSASGALYLTSVTFNFAGSSIDASNLANYIMYEDTNNQCTSKLTTVAGYIQNMSSDEKSSFQNSNDYVISTARTRLNAWAAHEGKTINWSTGTLSNTNRLVPLEDTKDFNTITLVIIISMVGVSSIGIYLYIRKKKSIN